LRRDIVIVGGGAGGLELACKLGRKLGPNKVVLVDKGLTHVWKPSLHEVAAGTLDIHQEGLSYQMLAHDNGFTFVYGPLASLDQVARHITVSAVEQDGADILPERVIAYSSLVIAVGSTSNYFGVPGASEHTISLNGTDDAERFRLTLLKLLTRADLQKSLNPQAGLDIVIIGGGATGVELAAELREASRAYADYGFSHINSQRDVRITLLEGAPRILAPLPERVSTAALRLLKQRAIDVHTGCKVTGIEAGHVSVDGGPGFHADLCVWAAGIRAPGFLAGLGLALNKGGQVEVDSFLRATGTDGIYAMGDCAACLDANGKPVPPRAQAAHQQADFLLDTLIGNNSGKYAYTYRDYGSLVSFGQSTTVGSLMGSLKGLSWFVEGFFARMMYVSLHLMHHRAVLGLVRTGVLAIARFLIKRSTPLVKLH
jgi:NADH dehydrogenase